MDKKCGSICGVAHTNPTDTVKSTVGSGKSSVEIGSLIDVVVVEVKGVRDVITAGEFVVEKVGFEVMSLVRDNNISSWTKGEARLGSFRSTGG